MSERIDLNGARAVVTGAGSGIGEAAALRFARGGAEVVCVDIDGDTAQATADACAALGDAGAHAYECDVADAEAVLALAGAVEVECGPVDVLVNNAGVGIAGPFLDSTVEDWQWLRGSTSTASRTAVYAFGPAMVARGRGHVVNIASGAAYIPNRHMAAYCASKAAVLCSRSAFAPTGARTASASASSARA